ncbi:MAG: multifunctional CCA addition/repair protein [Xanthomonadales bacterium]|nr:multifunctional CCA addition/repair protein [Xanthomonadales bacterium]
MKTYLVGGAIRDELLGLTVKEKDWVITGSSAEEMLALGYRQVGADFPVFLHPENGDEYALARTERKSGQGYHGFSVDFHPRVSLEEDLQRRDLTINAMARSSDGELTDPWGGQADLEARIMRHVSPAFAEDPLRVLRVARFAARFAPQGFKVAAETMQLMTEMAASGELKALTPERVFSEFRKAFICESPSVFIQLLRDCGALEVLLPEVNALFGIPQPEQYHPEIDTGVHTLLAIDRCALLAGKQQMEGQQMEGQQRAMLVFVVLLHDLGKALSPKQYLPKHYGHEAKGVPLVLAVCQRLRVPKAWQQLAILVCHWHLHCHRVQEMRPQKVLELLEHLDVFRQPSRLPAFLHACQADAQGRTGLEENPYPQAEYLSEAYRRVAAVSTKGLADLGDGKEIAAELRSRRLQALADIRDFTPSD